MRTTPRPGRHPPGPSNPRWLRSCLRSRRQERRANDGTAAFARLVPTAAAGHCRCTCTLQTRSMHLRSQKCQRPLRRGLLLLTATRRVLLLLSRYNACGLSSAANRTCYSSAQPCLSPNITALLQRCLDEEKNSQVPHCEVGALVQAWPFRNTASSIIGLQCQHVLHSRQLSTALNHPATHTTVATQRPQSKIS